MAPGCCVSDYVFLTLDKSVSENSKSTLEPSSSAMSIPVVVPHMLRYHVSVLCTIKVSLLVKITTYHRHHLCYSDPEPHHIDSNEHCEAENLLFGFS